MSPNERESGDIIMEAAWRRWIAAGCPKHRFVHFWMRAEHEYERGTLDPAGIPPLPFDCTFIREP